ncbi:hypothetical protein BAE44_0024669 [Dichanthelium oligosanthes]|uniref:Phytocyanin domain-containing protein n=1 Tax=Dichanthelium oligosanthes TaxID=888268 RepID=A0A1E5UN69_9POAL|nr:hypothetical protein BAE44_0024669 [Dichanthelium oligosanthes]
MASRSALLLCVSVVLAAAAAAEARDFVSSGANNGGWKAQSQPDALTRWSSANRFQVGDNFGKNVQVGWRGGLGLEVTRDDYNRCSTYSCQKGERLLVVMSEEHGRGRLQGLAPVPAPAPAPEAESPLADSFVGGPAAAPAPASGAAGKTAVAGTGTQLFLSAAAVLGCLLVRL